MVKPAVCKTAWPEGQCRFESCLLHQLAGDCRNLAPCTSKQKDFPGVAELVYAPVLETELCGFDSRSRDQATMTKSLSFVSYWTTAGSATMSE